MSAADGKRIPDFDPAATIRSRGTVVEVKSGKSPLGWSRQLADLQKYARGAGGKLEIFTNRPLRGTLLELRRRGLVIVRPIPKGGA